jgi:hypothetical protein
MVMNGEAVTSSWSVLRNYLGIRQEAQNKSMTGRELCVYPFRDIPVSSIN